MNESPDVIEKQIADTRLRILHKLQALEQKASLRRQFQRHPWAALGASAIAGYAASYLIHRTQARKPLGGDAGPLCVESNESRPCSKGPLVTVDLPPHELAAGVCSVDPAPVEAPSARLWSEVKSIGSDVLSRLICRTLLQAVTPLVERFSVLNEVESNVHVDPRQRSHAPAAESVGGATGFNAR